MERDIYRIFAKQEEIVIVGATGVACLYGVYAYLRQIGFAFFAPRRGKRAHSPASPA